MQTNYYIILIYFLLVINTVLCRIIPLEQAYLSADNNPIVRRLQQYIQIDTSVDENIEKSVEFWRQQAYEIGLPFTVHRPGGKPICVITWAGTEPTLPSLVINSHADVVPAEPEFWTNPPFSGHIDENGDMYGRGTQDTKSLGIQHLEALRELRNRNETLKRTIHMTIMPDEETGGFFGIKPFIKTDAFKRLNIGFALDEGISTSEDNTIYVTYQDKRPFQVKFTMIGESGHGSSMPDGTASEKMQRLIDAAMNYRSQLKQVIATKSATDFGAYTTLNVNIVKGGIANNVIPKEVEVVMDMRLATFEDASEIPALMELWRTIAGNGTSVEYIRADEYAAATPVDNTNSYWVAMKDVARDIGIKLVPVVCPATTDMLVLRNIGIPAFGFAPKMNVENRLHNINEYIPVDVFLRGIDVYVAMLRRLGNL